MRADHFRWFASGLGLTQDGLKALLAGGEMPQIEDAGYGFVLVLIDPANALPGCEGIPVRVKESTMAKWIKELHQQRGEGEAR